MATTERLLRHTVEGFLICICGNEPSFDGFYMSDADGTTREPKFGEGWDRIHMTCLGCGRVFVFETGEVVGRTTPEMLAGAMA